MRIRYERLILQATNEIIIIKLLTLRLFRRYLPSPSSKVFYCTRTKIIREKVINYHRLCSTLDVYILWYCNEKTIKWEKYNRARGATIHLTRCFAKHNENDRTFLQTSIVFVEYLILKIFILTIYLRFHLLIKWHDIRPGWNSSILYLWNFN